MIRLRGDWQDKNAYPLFAKATLPIFRKAIDYNKQAEEGLHTIYEEDARKLVEESVLEWLWL